jgi:mannose-6-phosphate isomerase-like protein (cupin superfamily)
MKSQQAINVLAALNSFTPVPADLMLLEVLSSPYPYQQGMVKAILEGGKQITLESAEEMWPYVRNGCLKIEGMEKLSQKLWDFCNLVRTERGRYKPVSCHIFNATQGAPSFPDHTDPEDVYLYVVGGEKTLIVEGKEVVLKAGDSLCIPAGTTHRAVNHKASCMLSIGFDKFILEKL